MTFHLTGVCLFADPFDFVRVSFWHTSSGSFQRTEFDEAAARTYIKRHCKDERDVECAVAAMRKFVEKMG